MTPAPVGESIDTPLLGELRYGLELARLLRDPVFLTARPQRHAPPVLLVPGFMAGDASLTVLRGWLRRRGSRTSSAGIRLNVDCAEHAVGRLEVRLRRLAERAGRRAVVIGQSRGGELARVLATRNPDAVSTLVMLGSPVVAPLSVGRPVLSAVRSVARLGDLGVPGVFSTRCADGECCATFREDLLAPLAPDVRAVCGLLPQRRHRFVAGVPRSRGPPRGGRIEPRRDVGPPRRLPAPGGDPRGGVCMDWMSPQDASFLHIEGSNTPMHIGGVSIFEGPPPSFERLEEMVAGKLDAVPRYRQRVRFVPLALGRPVWVDDPHFKLAYHLRHSALPAPGTEEVLRRTAARIFAQHLDRRRPLWEIWMIEGAEQEPLGAAVQGPPLNGRRRFGH